MEIEEQINSDDEEIMHYSSETDRDNEEDLDDSDSKDEGKGNRKREAKS